MHFFTTLLALSVTLSGVSGAAIRRDQCYEDNTLRALERYASEAAAFCPKFLAGSVSTMPDWVGKDSAAHVSSACDCFDKTASPATSTQAPPTTATGTTAVTTAAADTNSASNPTSASVSSTASPMSVSDASTTPATGSTSSGKRGLVYDYNSKTSYGQLFVGSKYASWGSNWGATRAIGNGVSLDNSFSFVPTLGVDSSLKNANWISTVQNLISTGGVTKLFSSNEPDNNSQANLTPQQAAQVYKQYMMPFAGKAKLATPAITNGGGQAGLTWLGNFVNACSGCTFDLVNVHSYFQRTDLNVDQAVSALKSYLLNDVPKLMTAHPQLKDAKIVVGEFWLWGQSETEGGQYLQKIMPWMDANPQIDSYQAFGGLWTTNFITSDGKGLTPAGQAYRDYETTVAFP